MSERLCYRDMNQRHGKAITVMDTVEHYFLGERGRTASLYSGGGAPDLNSMRISLTVGFKFRSAGMSEESVPWSSILVWPTGLICP